MKLNIYADRDDIRAHALEETADMDYPRECCGLIVRTGGHKQKIMRCRNISTEPEHHFLMHPADFRAAEQEGELLAYYHSHYEEGPEANEADKTVSEAQKLPCIIYSVTADLWSVYFPCGWRAKLEGRPFFHGILDCYTLVRDYYDEVLSIKLDDFHREDDWWKTGEQSLYLEHAHSQGFVQVRPPIHMHDVLLIYWLASVPNHAAVYCEPDMILHHPPGHVSGKVAYGGFYHEHTHGIYRYHTLL
jgi:proteasome lid subunit RPN8/RPN11